MKFDDLKTKKIDFSQEDYEKLTELFDLLVKIDARRQQKISTHEAKTNDAKNSKINI